MRIGQFCDSFLPIVDGVGRALYSYAEELSHMGHECYVIAPMIETSFRGSYPFDMLDYWSVKMPIVHQYYVGAPLLDGHYRKRIASIPFDVLHAHSPFVAGHEALRLKKKLGVPLVASFHSKYYDDFYKIFRNKPIASFGAHLVADFYEQCDLVIAVSDDAAEVLRSYGYQKQMIVIPNGTNLRTPNEEAAQAVRTRYPGKRLLLYVGQMDWKKNILRTLEVTQALHEKGEPVQLILVGQGADMAAIRKKVHQLGLDACVDIVGHVYDREQLDAYYHAADLFMFPSLYDTSSLVMREAAAMGTPSLLIQGSAPASVIHDGENGYLCPDETPAIAERVALILKDQEALDEVGQAAKNTIPIPWQKVLKGVETQYERLVEENERRRARSLS